jgi:hypothetical protein
MAFYAKLGDMVCVCEEVFSMQLQVLKLKFKNNTMQEK